jgi:hypothetical protein
LERKGELGPNQAAERAGSAQNTLIDQEEIKVATDIRLIGGVEETEIDQLLSG